MLKILRKTHSIFSQILLKSHEDFTQKYTWLRYNWSLYRVSEWLLHIGISATKRGRNSYPHCPLTALYDLFWNWLMHAKALATTRIYPPLGVLMQACLLYGFSISRGAYPPWWLKPTGRLSRWTASRESVVCPMSEPQNADYSRRIFHLLAGIEVRQYEGRERLCLLPISRVALLRLE